jgi:hypothetical protein
MAQSTHTPMKSSAPRRRTGRYFVAAALVPLCLLALLGAGLYAAAKRGPTQFTGGSSTHIWFWTKGKDEVLREAGGNRIVLYGGSGVLYSVRAQTLGARFDRPVVNMGLHAGLGLDYLLYRARRELRPNDIAVLFLEYSHYVRQPRDWTLADYAIPFDLRYLVHAGPHETIELAGKITPAEYLRKVRSGWFGVAEASARSQVAINFAGDFIANKASEQKDYHRKTLNEQRPFGGHAVDATQAAKIAAFVDWCRRNGIQVVAGFPAFLDWPSYHINPEAAFFMQVEALYRKQGVPTLGAPQDFMFPKAMFFDTSYHMNDLGAAAMTDLVATRLARVARCDIFHDWSTTHPSCGDNPRHQVFDLAQEGTPKGLQALTGFSWREPWGRWTDGPQASLRVDRPLDSPFRLEIVMPYVYAEKAPLQVSVRAGTETRSFVAQPGNATLLFEGSAGNDRIDISIPEQPSPKTVGASTEDRRIGLGIARVEVLPRLPK